MVPVPFAPRGRNRAARARRGVKFSSSTSAALAGAPACPRKNVLRPSSVGRLRMVIRRSRTAASVRMRVFHPECRNRLSGAPLRGDRFVWPVRLITDLGAVAIDPTTWCGDRCADRRRADRDLPLKFHPAATRASAGLVRSPLLDRRELEFSGLCHAGGLAAPAGVMRETGGLLPMAPCGRSSL